MKRGNKTTTFAQLCASNHSSVERAEHDYYSTDPRTISLFLNVLERDGITLSKNVWECACGEGHISKVLIKCGYNVRSTDLIDRGYGEGGIDFLATDTAGDYNIVTNPPYGLAQEFVEHALSILADQKYCVMLLKIQFLEGKRRRSLFNTSPPKYVYVHSERQLCYLNGDMSKKMSSASCYCWFIWEKGFEGEPIIRWI